MTCIAGCTATGQLRYRGAVVGRARKSLRSGRGTLVVRFTASGRKRLRRARTAKLSYRVTVRAKGRSGQASDSLTLAR